KTFSVQQASIYRQSLDDRSCPLSLKTFPSWYFSRRRKKRNSTILSTLHEE
ncbi:hypothetical protein ACHAXM_005552, partial [Skeletonema potamos]